jgi:TolB-like protein
LPAPAALALPDKPSIAVLPFQNMSGDPEQKYFTDGMVEDIITELSRFRVLFVIARNSTFTYMGKVMDVKQVGRELGVRYVVEGSIRKAGDRVRVTAQLIDAAWSAVERMLGIDALDDRTLTHCGATRVMRGAGDGGIADLRRHSTSIPIPPSRW